MEDVGNRFGCGNDRKRLLLTGGIVRKGLNQWDCGRLLGYTEVGPKRDSVKWLLLCRLAFMNNSPVAIPSEAQ